DFTMRTEARKAGWRAMARNGLRRGSAGVYGSRPMYGVIVAVHVLVSLFLIFVILLQPGRADGMAAFGGGGSTTSVFGGRGSVTFLAKVTAGCAIIFMITSLVLAFRSSHSASVLQARRNLAAQDEATKKAAGTGTAPAKLPTGDAVPAPATGG